jgi:hypothetical protein
MQAYCGLLAGGEIVVTGFFGGVMSVTGLRGFCGVAGADGIPAGYATAGCSGVTVIGSGRPCG